MSEIPRRHVPEGTLLRGRMRPVQVAHRGGVATVEMPRWALTFGFIYMRLRIKRDRPRPLRGFSLFTGLRPEIGEAENIYRRCRLLTLEPPFRLHWWRNLSPTRAWTGREREVFRIDYWTPRGWKSRILRSAVMS